MLKYFRGFIKYFFLLSLIVSFSSTALCTEDEQTLGLPVLLYHHVLEDSMSQSFQNNDAVNSYEEFKMQMKYLYDNGYKTITTKQLYDFLYNNTVLPPKSVMITFDDGYLSDYYYAYPVLKQYGYTAAIFLITGNIRLTEEPFDPKQVQFLSWQTVTTTGDVFEYGCHTHDLHYFKNSNSVLVTSPAEVIMADIDASLKLNNTKIYAYPYGVYNNGIINILKSKNFNMAFSNVKGYIKPTDNKFALKRFSVKRGTTFQEFKDYIDKK